MSDCNGDCPSCRASSVHNELDAESLDWLTQIFATLKRRFERRRQVELLIRRERYRDVWEYPYE